MPKDTSTEIARPGIVRVEPAGGHPSGRGDGRRARAELRRPNDPTLRELVESAAREWRVIAVVLSLAIVAAAAYVLVADPSYESNVVLQVDENTVSRASTSGTGPSVQDIVPAFVEKTATDTEIEILKSRALLGAVIDELQLDLEAKPLRFPVVGDAFARAYHRTRPAPARLGLARYGWGGERIRLSRLNVPEDLVEEPLRLTALDGGRWRLASDGGDPIAEGEVGKPATGADHVEVLVTELVARPGTEFRVMHRDRAVAIRELEKVLRIAERGRKTGVVQISMTGKDRQEVARILNALTTIYLRRNVERRSAETDRTIQFIDAQLEVLRPSVQKAEAALKDFQQRKGTVSLSRETEAIVSQIVDVESEISQAELERSALSQKFAGQHPAIVTATQRVDKLRERKARLEAQMRQLPKTELDSARLSRDVKVSSELYGSLLNKAQELRILKPGIVGNVRLVDAAVPARKPAGFSPLLIVLGSIVLGSIGGIAAAFGRRALRDVVDVPDDIEKHTGVPVYVAVPHSTVQDGLAHRSSPQAPARVLASADPTDVSVEALRSLRTSLQFALVGSRNNVVSIGSPAPGAGKSFVVANLAVLLADTGRKVLVVDGDLRRGILHRSFGLLRTPGLTSVLTGSATLDAALLPTPVAGLHMLATGPIPPNPSELLASQQFEALVAAVSQRYDLVLIDAPPVLAVTDGTLIAGSASVNLLVLRAGHQSMREVELALERYAQNGTSVSGCILNDARAVLGKYGRYGKRYSYGSVS